MHISSIDVDLKLLQQSQEQIVADSKKSTMQITIIILLCAAGALVYSNIEKRKLRELHLLSKDQLLRKSDPKTIING